MRLIICTIKKEKQRIDYMLEKYRKTLAGLPKGTISEKSQWEYLRYLKYRDGKKVVSKYIGKNDVESIRRQIEKRRHVETIIQSLTKEQILAEKVLEEKI